MKTRLRNSGLLQDDRTQTVRSLASQLEVGKSSVHKMLKKDLKFSKLCPRFVPKDLDDDQRCERVRLCQENLDSLKADDSFISKIITGDESWIAVMELQTKQASLQWLPKGTVSERPSKAQPQRGEKKSMFTIFFDQRGPVLSEFKLPNETVTFKTYIEVMRTLRESGGKDQTCGETSPSSCTTTMLHHTRRHQPWNFWLRTTPRSCPIYRTVRT